MKKTKLSHILNLLVIGEMNEEIQKKDLPPGGFDEFRQFHKLFNEITENLNKNVLGKSDIAKHLLFFCSLSNLKGMIQYPIP